MGKNHQRKKIDNVLGHGRDTDCMSDMNISMRPSFMNPFHKHNDDEPCESKKSVCSADADDFDHDHDHKKDPTKMNPAEIQANLNMFMADQKAEQNANKILFLSPDEREKMEKAKMKVKVHFQGFFRRHMIKGSQAMFDKWVAFV
jgi:hypothetical protein